MGAAGAATSTTLVLDDRDVDVSQYAVSALGGRSWPSGWAVRGSLGSVLGGRVEEDGQRHDIGIGVVGGVAGSRRWTFGPWFVTGSAGLSASRVTTTAAAAGASGSMVATDLRAGAIAGRTFGIASPYLLARGFGGPVFWSAGAMDVSGGDKYHFQLGAGLSVSTAGGWSLLVDVSALGERSASLGASLRL